MRFSARGEYGVRVMVELARHEGGGPVTLAHIADEEGMPLPFLEHIIADLRAAGLVAARRGRRGGYHLARAASEITMGEVVRVLEGGISPMICIPGDPGATDTIICAHQEYCTTRILWIRVRDSIIQALESTALADLVPGAAVPVAGGPRVVAAPLHPVLSGTGECHQMVAVDREHS
jgi:Rrf2 family transcriptional regulator, cysteine metabolism repressor